MPLVARNSRCDAIRFSSVSSIRIHVARGRQLDPEQLLGGQREHQLVEQRREVVHAGDVGAALQVGELLAGLLHAGVQVADDRLAPQHRLALELQHEAQHAVGARVLRPHVDDHRLVVAGHDVRGLRPARPLRPRSCAARRRPRAAARWPLSSLRGRSSWPPSFGEARVLVQLRVIVAAHGRSASRRSSRLRCALELHGDAAHVVVLAQRVADPVLGHQDAGEVGVAARS